MRQPERALEVNAEEKVSSTLVIYICVPRRSVMRARAHYIIIHASRAKRVVCNTADHVTGITF